MLQMIRKGQQIQIEDSKTGKDITSRILAQIILDLDTTKAEWFPAELLHLMIRSNDQYVSDFFDQYFTSAFSVFLKSRKAFEDQYLNSMKFDGVAPLEWMKNMWSAFGVPGSTHPPSPDSDERGREEELKRKIRDLELKLKDIEDRMSS